MTYEQALEKIDSLLVFGVKPGLERLKRLLTVMRNPQEKLKYIHVAGTNGKGSVCNMTARILTAQGYKTGLFTSPHITGFGERMQIDFKQIPKEDIIDEVERLFPLVEMLKNLGTVITEFEFVTAMAFDWFARNKCDYVVLETGLGGRFDATNVVHVTLCSIITSISLDHTAVLGDTLAKIAYEKSGIIKMGRAVVYNRQEDEVNSVIENEAAKKGCKVYIPEKAELTASDIDGSIVRYRDKEVLLPLLGEHQIRNLSLVLCAVDVLREQGVEISDKAVRDGLSAVRIPARFERISDEPLVILDGAHNPGGLEALADSVDRYLYDKNIICIMGMLKDKDSKTALAFLKGKLYKVITTQVNDNPRRLTAEELKAIAGEYFTDITAESDNEKAVNLAFDTADKTENPAILICGSLYLASEIREIITKRM